MTPKISLFKYMTGQLDIEKIRAANGLGPSPRAQKRKRKLESKPAHPSGTKGDATDKAKAAAAAAKAPPNANFTAADDERILEWKAANQGKPWKPLADELGKAQALLKERFKELNSGAEGGNSGNADAEKDKEKDKDKDKDKDKEKGKVKDNNSATAGQQEKGKKGGEKGKGDKGAGDADEAELVKFLVKEDEEDKWLRIASRIFDRTGKAVHPEDLRERHGKK